MSERGKALLAAILESAKDGELASLESRGYLGSDIRWDTDTEHTWDALPTIARAICEHLGITWSAVDAIDGLVQRARSDAIPVGPLHSAWDDIFAAKEASRALATLLEAAGMER